ncbi:glycerol-3-phosphate dehydrogenase/oxidase [Methylomicrobium sp. RS1]|jgi:glycerol-3-phosphate dehydrogenase|uniref:glycerol-3-phosphate dehydrogenase/oxidase n=1 Tax=Candidatus Methylomicrobium oryzae TaxID=2802053 RepID=UPI001922222B|nr:glycerol-3-phosphate dehydrogenase/oxidase [Methylomicrobium sp. RS1]MBL1264458.1 glycerol-3-phosphate dehydrogenase/oxidase [Methylomicrobium sp. RS1]
MRGISDEVFTAAEAIKQMMVRDFSRLDGQIFDVLICGGGIYGAWTAYDAALRGLKVALVDRGDWANATSSASSKLVHGGLRYLENFDFKLVRKTLAERQMLLAAAPHRVRPLRFGVPVYRGGRLDRFRLAVGLTLYDGLAGAIGGDHGFRYYGERRFAGRFPFLRADGLKAGFTYLDAQTDDARLVLELVAGAQSAGAVCVNYCEASDFLERDGKLSAAVVTDRTTGESMTVRARHFVNTAGQWAFRLRQGRQNYRLSKGVHLVLPNLLGNEALLLTAQADGRVFFMIPWYGRTLVGTTDTDYSGDIDAVRADAEDIDYLLNEVNHFARNTHWTKDDIIGAFAGLRVLKASDDSSPSAVSRDWALHAAPNGLLTSIGGKLTSARSDAAQIVDRLCRELSKPVRCATFGKPLPWSPSADFPAWSEAMIRRAVELGIDRESAEWLLFRYGSRVPEIFEQCGQQPGSAARIVADAPFIVADLLVCARTEMVVHLEDLLRRRLPLLILAKLAPKEVRRIAETIAPVLGWDQDRIEAELKSTCVS